jgi:hypothetical protein
MAIHNAVPHVQVFSVNPIFGVEFHTEERPESLDKASSSSNNVCHFRLSNNVCRFLAAAQASTVS